MADGRVEIKFLTDTADIEKAKKAVQQLGADVERSLTISGGNTSQVLDDTAQSASEAVDQITRIKPQADNASSGIKNIGDTSQQSTGGVKNLVSALGMFKVASVAINAVRDSLDSAISRVDTMNAFPRMMEQVGFSAESSRDSIDRLSDGIQGLPTRLDEVVSTTQQLALTTGDLEEATELTLSLNNAFLASGASSGDASRGLQQFSQMLSSGKVDMQSWRTLLETMPLALTRVAEGFGFAGESAKNDLYTALQEGTITFDEFTGKLIELNDGVGGFAELALTNSEGIATSFANIRTAVVTGVANTIQALDDLVVGLTGQNIAQHFDNLKNVVRTAFNTISSGIRNSLPYIQSAISIFQRLLPVIVGLGTAFTAFRVITSVTQWFSNLSSVINVVRSTKAAYLGISQALLATETSATTVQRLLATGYALLTGQISLTTAATAVFNSTLTALSGPLGIVLTLLGTLATAGYLIYDVFGTVRESVSGVTEGFYEVTESSDEVLTRVRENQQGFGEELQEIENRAGGWKNLADEIIRLSEKENLSAQEKIILKDNIDLLNDSVEGLNLSYDEEIGKLNLSREAIYKRIDAMTDMARAEAAQQRMTEILQEQFEVETQLATNARKLAMIQDQPHLKEDVTPLVESTKELMTLQEDLANEYTYVEGVIAQSMLSQVATVEDGTQRQIVAFSDLSEQQKAVIDELASAYEEYTGIATDMFSKLDTESETTVTAMIENLQHNQEALSTYAENMKAIEEAVAELDPSGEFLTTLQNLGPSAAGEVSNIASSIGTDSFSSLVTTFTDGGEEAKDALLTALGIEESELPDGIDSLISNAETSLSEQIESSGLNEIGKILVDEIGAGIADNEEQLQEDVKTIIDKVPEWIDPDTDIIKESAKEIPQAIGEGVTENEEVMQVEIEKAVESSVVESISSQSETSVEQGSQIVDDISSGVTENQETLQNAIEEAISIPEGTDETVGDESTSMGKSIIDGAKMGVDENKSTFADALKLAGEEALASFKTASGVASPSTLYQSATADIVAGAVNGIVANQANLVNSVRTMANLSISAFTQAQPRAYSAGRNLGLGFNSGLDSTRSSIVSTATIIANAAANAINTALEIASPSRKGIYSGNMLGQGVGIGLEQEIGYVEGMAERLALSAIPQFNRIDVSRQFDLPETVYSGYGNVATAQVREDEEVKELLRIIADKNPVMVADDDTILARYRPRMDRQNGIIAKNTKEWRLT